MSPRSEEPGCADGRPTRRPTYCRLHVRPSATPSPNPERLPFADSGSDRPHSYRFRLRCRASGRAELSLDGRPIRSPRETGPDRRCRRPVGRSATPRDRPTHPPAVPGSPPVPAAPLRGVPVPPRVRNHLAPPRRIPPPDPPIPHRALSGSSQAPVRTHPPATYRPPQQPATPSSVRPSSVRQPVADRSAPISPGSMPLARSFSGSPNRPARAAQMPATRYRNQRYLPYRQRAGAQSASASISTANSPPRWTGRPERRPAHLRSPRRARQPAPRRRWRRPERAWWSAS